MTVDRRPAFFSFSLLHFQEEGKDNSIKRTYKKGNNTVIDNINNEAKQITKELKLEKKLINQLPLKECYITLKDHKDSFFSKPETRLINP